MPTRRYFCKWYIVMTQRYAACMSVCCEMVCRDDLVVLYCLYVDISGSSMQQWSSTILPACRYVVTSGCGMRDWVLKFSIFCQVPGDLYWILPICEIIFGWQLMCFQEFWNTICHEMDSQCQCYWRSFPPVLRWPPGNIFRVTGHLCGGIHGCRWNPRTKASDAELWCFLWSPPE